MRLYRMAQEDFEKAAEDVKKLSTTPSNDDLLILYALYKQGTVGDNNTGTPFWHLIFSFCSCAWKTR